MAAFYTYIYSALRIFSDPSILSNELNCLKSLALSRGKNPSSIDTALNEFKKPVTLTPCLNPVVFPFYPLISLEISKLFSRFDFKTSFMPITKLNYTLQKITFLLVRIWIVSILFFAFL